MSRRDELAARLAALRDRVERACRSAERDPAEVAVVVVTKTFPASDIRLLAAMGVHDIGENRDQEAAPKAVECADLELTWHFVGQLQRNKAASVARYASVVHSVDRPRLVGALDRAAASAGRVLRCLVQVSLADDEPGRPLGGAARAGAAADQVIVIADLIAEAQSLQLGGVMAVAPLVADPDAAFARLADVAATVRNRHSTAIWISAGMSADLEAAIHHGATHLRVGSAILGTRPPGG